MGGWVFFFISRPHTPSLSQTSVPLPGAPPCLARVPYKFWSVPKYNISIYMYRKIEILLKPDFSLICMMAQNSPLMLISSSSVKPKYQKMWPGRFFSALFHLTTATKTNLPSPISCLGDEVNPYLAKMADFEDDNEVWSLQYFNI